MKISKHIPMILFLCLWINSCSIIPEENRLLSVENPTFNQVTLLEDYTGQKCVNCPKAAEEIKNLEKIYSKNLVSVSIHAGAFALPALATAAGEEYNTKFGVDAYPKGMVNRTKHKNTLTLDYQNWGQAIRNMIWQKSGITLTPEMDYNATDSLLNIKVRVEKQPALLSQNLSLQCWIIESKIVAIQYMPDGSKNREYEHEHALRDAINGTWGESLHFTQNNALSIVKNYSLKNRKWKPENCDVVIFVYKTDTYEILETLKKSLTN